MKSTTRLIIICVLVVVIAASAVIVILQNRQDDDDSGSASSAKSSVTVAGLGSDASGSLLPAQGGKLTGPVTATFSVSIDRSVFPLVSSLLSRSYPNAQELLEAAANIADNFLLEGTWDNSAAQLKATLKGQQVGYAALRSEGNTLTMVSDMLPDNTAVQTTANELMRSIGAYYGDRELNLSFTPDDLETLENAATALIRKIDSGIAARTGTEENGTWTFEGKTFTSRRPVDATMPEIGVITLEAVQDTLRSPEISDLLSRFGVEQRNLDLSYQIESMKNASADNAAVPEFYRYTNAEGDTYTDGVIHTFNTRYHYDSETYEETVTREPGDNIYVQYGTVGGNILARLSVPSSGECRLTAASDGSSYELNYSISQIPVSGSGISLSGKLCFSGKTAPNGERDGSITVQVSGLNVLTMNYTIRRGEKITASFDTYGKKIYSLSDIRSSDFRNQIKTKLLEVAGKVNGIMPDEVSTLMPIAEKILRRIF